jgi:hypothetical protein
MTSQPVDSRGDRSLGDPTVLVITREDWDDALSATFRRAVQLVGGDGTIVLYDRSQETWGDTPHAEGPLDADSALLDDVAHVRQQLELLANSGVKAVAWRSSLQERIETTTPNAGLEPEKRAMS